MAALTQHPKAIHILITDLNHTRSCCNKGMKNGQLNTITNHTWH